MAKKNKLTQGIMSQLLDWAYEKAISGFSGVDSAYALGDSYLKEKGTLDDQVKSLIKWQVAKSAASGFLTGFGGLITIPFTVPANVASVIYIQVRMITAIAYMGGHDIQSDRVKSLCFISMAGNGAKELLKDIGMRAGEKVILNALNTASIKALEGSSQKVGAKLLGKLGTNGAGKIVPVVGGVISATFDGMATKAVGMAAKKIFIDQKNNNIEIIETDNIINK